MLVDLAIRNFAIIDSLEIPFKPGLNVLTGETGAGKSILIDALGAVLGERVSVEQVRTGARLASIDARFDIGGIPMREDLRKLLEKLDVTCEDGELILSREIHAGGRSVARLNGRPTTAAILAQIGALLVDIHGQSEHLSLLRPAAQLELVDRFAHTDSLRQELASKLRDLRQLQQARHDALTGARERMQRIDLLRYQIDEIGRAAPEVGEDERLESEQSRLAHADRLVREAAVAYGAFAGDEDGRPGGAAPALREAAQTLSLIAAIDPAARSLEDRTAGLLYMLEDLARELRDYRDSVEADPQRLLAVEERLDELRTLKRKYGAEISEILDHAQQAEEELERLAHGDVDAETLAARAHELEQEVGALAGLLSRQRAEAALELAAGVEGAIAQLNMGAARFAVTFDREEESNGVPVSGDDGSMSRYAVDATGIDRVSFLIAPNAGEGLKPLHKIASGGETARLMLALKSVLSTADKTPVLVFDEIDVGVGGRSGQVVGEKLWALTEEHQVIAITHLPQIAAFADTHFQIAKGESDGRVVSMVRQVSGKTRTEELAAMLDGLPISAAGLRSAREMLERAEQAKHEQRNAV
jgi:DNA repair protein RecN (Recombination protein N)